MSEGGEEIKVNPKYSPDLKDRYSKVREFVQQSVEKGLQSTRAKPSDVKLLRRGAFFAAEETLEKSMTDPTTGLPKRDWMEKELEIKASLATRKDKPFRIMFMDLDYFKRINDGYGHSVGDEILKCIGTLPARKEEPIARWGGEEFLQILENNSDSENLSIVIERYMKAVKEATKKILSNHPYMDKADPNNKLDHMEISFGITDYIPGTPIKDVIKLADQALYQAKGKRNTAVYARLEKDGNIIFEELKTAQNPSFATANTI